MIDLVNSFLDLDLSVIQDLLLFQVLLRIVVSEILIFQVLLLISFILLLCALKLLLGLLDRHFLLRDVLSDLFFALIGLKHGVHALGEQRSAIDKRIPQGLCLEWRGVASLLLVFEEVFYVSYLILKLQKLLV